MSEQRKTTSNDVTITIFAASNSRLFKKLELEGIPDREDAEGNVEDGIYYIKNLTILPYVIIATNELKGREYAMYRALTDRADAKDVECLILDSEKEVDTSMRDRYRRLLCLIEAKNPGLLEELIERREGMDDYLMDLMKPRIEKGTNKAVQDAIRSNLFLYVQDGDMLLEKAAKRAGLSEADFASNMERAGYEVPKSVPA